MSEVTWEYAVTRAAEWAGQAENLYGGVQRFLGDVRAYHEAGHPDALMRAVDHRDETLQQWDHAVRMADMWSRVAAVLPPVTRVEMRVGDDSQAVQ